MLPSEAQERFGFGCGKRNIDAQIGWGKIVAGYLHIDQKADGHKEYADSKLQGRRVCTSLSHPSFLYNDYLRYDNLRFRNR